MLRTNKNRDQTKKSTKNPNENLNTVNPVYNQHQGNYWWRFFQSGLHICEKPGRPRYASSIRGWLLISGIHCTLKSLKS